jgi:DNA-binding transcriptional LysR family regulator
MELRHLRCFVAVAEELHFGRAAERLYIAQSALSQQVQRLERELGVELLQRNKRRVRLTEVGRVFVEEARRTLEQAERAADTAKRAARGQVGKLEVGFFGPATYHVLPKILATYRERFPEVELALHEWTSSRQLEQLRAGRIRVGFLCGPVHAEEGLVVEHVFREAVVVALPERHPAASREAIALETLAGDPFIMVPRREEPTGHDQYVSLCLLAGFSPRVVQEAHQIHTAVALVASGVGACLVPASVRNLHREGVVYRALLAPTAELETAVVRGREATPVLRTFLGVVGELSVARANLH